jgi:beta-lactamase regulating signal transducer with metallopeptidase domain
LNFLLDLGRDAAQVFFAGLWQGAILIAVVALAFRFCSRVGPQLRFAVWGFAFVVLLVGPLLNLEAPSSSTATIAAKIHLSAIWEYAIALLWIVLMATRAVQLVVHLSRVRGTWKCAKPIAADDKVHDLLRRSSRPVELCSSTDVDSPSVIGFWSPRLLIPEWLLAKLTPEDLHQIVLHELEHLRRGDDWLNLMQKAGMVLFPLNPGLFWVDRRLSAERELACDAGVVASTAQPLEYARCLTRLAEHRSQYRKLALSLAAWSRESDLGRRVFSLLEPAGAWSSRHARLATASLVLVLAIGGVGMARAPHLITFGDAYSAAQPGAAAAVHTSESIVPVVYRETAPSRATLLKTTMRPASGTKSSHARALQPSLHRAHAVKPRRQHPRMLLTTARVSVEGRPSSPSGRLVRTVYVQPEFSPSFAAVPFADGWLIVQL